MTVILRQPILHAHHHVSAVLESNDCGGGQGWGASTYHLQQKLCLHAQAALMLAGPIHAPPMAHDGVDLVDEDGGWGVVPVRKRGSSSTPVAT
jgi:hypothetical protein